MYMCKLYSRLFPLESMGLWYQRRVLWPICCKCCPRRATHHHTSIVIFDIQLRFVSLHGMPGPEQSSPIARDGGGCQVPSGKSFIAIPSDFFCFVVMVFIVLHGGLEVSEILRSFDEIDIRAGQAHKVGVELLPLQRMCNKCRATELEVLQAPGVGGSFGLDCKFVTVHKSASLDR